MNDICAGSPTGVNIKGDVRVHHLDTSVSAPAHLFTVAQRYFAGSPRYGRIVSEAAECSACGMETKATILLASLPSEKHLMTELIEKLQGKSVHKTLMKIVKKVNISSIEEVKGWSSLMTHAAIEVEQGNIEYRMLLPRLYEKIGSLLVEV